MSDFWAFSIAGYFLPLILRAKGVDTTQSVADTYRSYVWICQLWGSNHMSDIDVLADLPGVTATFLAAAVSIVFIAFTDRGPQLMEIPRTGRKWAMIVSACLMGISLALVRAFT